MTRFFTKAKHSPMQIRIVSKLDELAHACMVFGKAFKDRDRLLDAKEITKVSNSVYSGRWKQAAKRFQELDSMVRDAIPTYIEDELEKHLS